MSDFQATSGRTEPMCSLPTISNPVLSPAADSPPLDPIRTMLEHLVARMARVEARMDEYDRRPSSPRHPHRPEPDPPDTAMLDTVAQLPQHYLKPQQPEMQDWLWQQHQPHTQPVQTRRPTSWDPPGYRQQSGFMPYDQYPLPYHHREKNQPLPSPPCCWDPPAQRALHGFPPHNQSYHAPQPQLDPTLAYGAPSYGLSTWDYRVRQEYQGCDQQRYKQWLDYYNQTQTEIPAAYTPSWRPESTSFDVAPMQSVAATKFVSEEGIYSYVYESKHRMREQEGAMSDSLILDAQVEYSCDDPKDFDCVSNRGMVEGEHCDIPERGLVSTDSILATEATKFIDREAAYSHTGNVSNQAIVVTSNISGEEGKLFDDEPPQPSPILQLYILDVSEEEEALEEDSIGEVKEIIASIHVARVSSQDVEICWNKRGGAYTGLKIIIYGEYIQSSGQAGRRGIGEWRRLTIQCAFDPGGESSPKLLFASLFVVSWFPP